MGAPRDTLYSRAAEVRSMVDETSVEVDKRYLAPAKQILSQSIKDAPFLTIFAVTLALFSIFPLISFMGFCLFSGAIIVASSLVFCLFWMLLVIGSGVFILLMILSIALGIAISVTVTAALVAICWRLSIHTKATSSLGQGIRDTIAEARQHVKGSVKQDKDKQEHLAISGSENGELQNGTEHDDKHLSLKVEKVEEQT